MAAKTKTPAKRGRKTKYDYEKAKEYFVEGWPVDPDDEDSDRDWLNLRQVSERMEIPYERIRERSASERWTDLRRTYQTSAARDRQKRRIEQLGRKSIEFDDRSLRIAESGLKLIGHRMNEIAELVQAGRARRDEAVERFKEGEHVERMELWTQVRSTEMVELARAAEVLQSIGRRALGTDVEHVQVDATVNGEVAISVAAELERDDPDRLASFVAAVQRADLAEILAVQQVEQDTDEDEDDADTEDGDEVYEAELVE